MVAEPKTTAGPTAHEWSRVLNLMYLQTYTSDFKPMDFCIILKRKYISLGAPE